MKTRLRGTQQVLKFPFLLLLCFWATPFSLVLGNKYFSHFLSVLVQWECYSLLEFPSLFYDQKFFFEPKARMITSHLICFPPRDHSSALLIALMSKGSCSVDIDQCSNF